MWNRAPYVKQNEKQCEKKNLPEYDSLVMAELIAFIKGNERPAIKLADLIKLYYTRLATVDSDIHNEKKNECNQV